MIWVLTVSCGQRLVLLFTSLFGTLFRHDFGQIRIKQTIFPENTKGKVICGIGTLSWKDETTAT